MKTQSLKKKIVIITTIGLLLIAVDIVAAPKGVEVIESPYGQLCLVRPEAGENKEILSAKAIIEGNEGVYEKNIKISITPYDENGSIEDSDDKGVSEKQMSERDKIEYELRKIIDGVNDDISNKKISLPVKLDSGEKIKWDIEERRRTNAVYIIFLIIFTIIAVCKEESLKQRKLQKKNEESVLKGLPGFVNRLVLLMNAGLVLNTAFEKAIEEGADFVDNEDDYFYKGMRNIYGSMKSANGSMNKELRRFASESGVRELMRVSNIINDNISKGVELTDKLQGESEVMWVTRKKHAEEMGKLAETKLILPLILMLMVLIVITIAPALLEL